MKILGIETSCDETGAAVVEGEKKDGYVHLLSNEVASSLVLHAKTGGIIPEVAAREQLKYIIPTIKEALGKANVTEKEIDAIAVTYGPGLIGSLLVGVETAKTLSYVWEKPLIPVNHLVGHIYANFIHEKTREEISFPAVVLVVSGGHTDIVLLKHHGDIVWLGGTRDDAAGEAFDKIGRLLGLPYPAGPTIARLAQEGNAKAFQFPRPLIGSGDFDFSFSGLKTAVFREVKTKEQLTDVIIADFSASVEKAIVDVLVTKTMKAVEKYDAKSLLISGGVAANELLRNTLEAESRRLNKRFVAPPKALCTDNGAMIAAAALFNNNPIPLKNILANPELHF